MSYNVTHLLSADDLTRPEVEELCDRANAFRIACATKNGAALVASRYRHQAGGTFFEESSTRTRISSTRAMQKLGLDVVSLSGDEAATQKGESMGITALTLGALELDVLVMRLKTEHAVAKAAAEMTEAAKRHADATLPVIINGGDGMNEHPTQALLDVATARNQLGRIDGTRWVFFGDLHYARTINSLLKMLAKFDGMHFTFVASSGLGISKEMRERLEAASISYDETDNLRAAAKGADVVYGVRTQAERHKHGVVASAIVLDHNVLRALKKQAIIMHPGPHGAEIPAYVYHDVRALFPQQQVTTGLYLRVAVFDKLLGSHAYNALLEERLLVTEPAAAPVRV
jgi:aspartate carbamoyltransferase